MANPKAPDEQIIDGLVEYFWHDLKMMFTYWVESRAFARKLSDEEQWARFSDPYLRAQEEALLHAQVANKVQPPSAVLQWYDAMAKIVSRYGPGGPGSEVAPTGPGAAGTETG